MFKIVRLCTQRTGQWTESWQTYKNKWLIHMLALVGLSWSSQPTVLSVAFANILDRCLTWVKSSEVWTQGTKPLSVRSRRRRLQRNNLLHIKVILTCVIMQKCCNGKMHFPLFPFLTLVTADILLSFINTFHSLWHTVIILFWMYTLFMNTQEAAALLSATEVASMLQQSGQGRHLQYATAPESPSTLEQETRR